MTPRAVLSPNELSTVAWHTSPSLSTGGSCGEAGPVRDGSRRFAVRHSHHPAGTLQACPAAVWTSFLAAVEVGDFDLPAA